MNLNLKIKNKVNGSNPSWMLTDFEDGIYIRDKIMPGVLCSSVARGAGEAISPLLHWPTDQNAEYGKYHVFVAIPRLSFALE